MLGPADGRYVVRASGAEEPEHVLVMRTLGWLLGIDDLESIDSLSVAQASANASVAKLMRDRTRLEGEIAQLIGRKSSLPEADYEKELERLFIELAKVNRAIKQGSNASEE